MPRLQSENPLIHFVLREIPLTKTKTTRFDERWLVISSEPSGQWLLCEISLWKSKVKHVDDFFIKFHLVWQVCHNYLQSHPRPLGRVGFYPFRLHIPMLEVNKVAICGLLVGGITLILRVT